MPIPNKSKSYLLPLFFRLLDLEYLENIFNTYCYKEEQDTDCFVIVYKNADSDRYRDYISRLSTNIPQNHCISLESYEDYTITTYDIPEELTDDYNNFILGRYSLFRPESKSVIIRFLFSHYGNAYVPIIKKYRWRHCLSSQT